MQRNPKTNSPPVKLDCRFYIFLWPMGKYVSAGRFWYEQMFLGKEGGISTWLIAIFWEHMDLPQTALQFFMRGL
jgi:hypothetical protein